MEEDDAMEEQQPQEPVLLRKSCDYCARMKRACDGGTPCGLCLRRGKTCERRLRRKSGPAKGAKYAPRRRKFDNEIALTRDEASAGAGAGAVTAKKSERALTKGKGSAGWPFGDTVDNSSSSCCKSVAAGSRGGGGAFAATAAAGWEPSRQHNEEKSKNNNRPNSGAHPACTSPVAAPPCVTRQSELKVKQEVEGLSPTVQQRPSLAGSTRNRAEGGKRGPSCSDSWSGNPPRSSDCVPRKRRFHPNAWPRAAARGVDEQAAPSPSDGNGNDRPRGGGDERAVCVVDGRSEVGRENSRNSNTGDDVVAPSSSKRHSRSASPLDIRSPARSRNPDERDEREQALVAQGHRLHRSAPTMTSKDCAESTTRYVATTVDTGWAAAAAATAASRAATAGRGGEVPCGPRRHSPSLKRAERPVESTAGRVVSVSPLKPLEAEEEYEKLDRRGLRRSKEAGGFPSRIQMWEPNVDATGMDFDSVSQKSKRSRKMHPPQGEQPLAPKDLLLMLRPNDQEFFDDVEGGSSQATLTRGGGGGGGGHRGMAASEVLDCNRRRSWSDPREPCREAGELPSAICGDSAPAAPGKQTKPDARETQQGATVTRSSPMFSGTYSRRGGSNVSAAYDRVDDCLWHKGGPGGGGDGGAIGGDRTSAYGGSGEYVGESSMVNIGHSRGELSSSLGPYDYYGSQGGCDGSSGFDGLVTAPFPHPHRSISDDSAPMWRYEGYHASVPFAGLAERERHHHFYPDATRLQPRHRLPPHHQAYQAHYHHRALMRGIQTYDSMVEANGGARFHTLPVRGGWTTTNPTLTSDPAFAQVIPSAYTPFPGCVDVGIRSSDQRNDETAPASAHRYWNGYYWSMPAALSGGQSSGSGVVPISISMPTTENAPLPRCRTDGPFRKRRRGMQHDALVGTGGR